MDSLPYKAFRLDHGIVEVLIVARRRPEGTWSIAVLQQLPGWGFRVSELTPVASEECIPRILEGFQRWAGGSIQEIDLVESADVYNIHLNGERQLSIDSGWVQLQDHRFFRMVEVG